MLSCGADIETTVCRFPPTAHAILPNPISGCGPLSGVLCIPEMTPQTPALPRLCIPADPQILAKPKRKGFECPSYP